jgi:hypothetical protein
VHDASPCRIPGAGQTFGIGAVRTFVGNSWIELLDTNTLTQLKGSSPLSRELKTRRHENSRRRHCRLGDRIGSLKGRFFAPGARLFPKFLARVDQFPLRRGGPGVRHSIRPRSSRPGNHDHADERWLYSIVMELVFWYYSGLRIVQQGVLWHYEGLLF